MNMISKLLFLVLFSGLCLTFEVLALSPATLKPARYVPAATIASRQKRILRMSEDADSEKQEEVEAAPKAVVSSDGTFYDDEVCSPSCSGGKNVKFCLNILS